VTTCSVSCLKLLPTSNICYSTYTSGEGRWPLEWFKFWSITLVGDRKFVLYSESEYPLFAQNTLRTVVVPRARTFASYYISTSETAFTRKLGIYKHGQISICRIEVLSGETTLKG
jgi:hypothetical protein